MFNKYKTVKVLKNNMGLYYGKKYEFKNEKI